MKLPFYAAVLLAGSALGLAGCDSADNADTAPAPAPQEEGVPGLGIANARLVLPAVKGNPGVVYFDLVNKGPRAYAVRRADVLDAARTEMHASMEVKGAMTMGEVGPQVVQPGGTLSFKPNGLHVMVFELTPEMVPGAKTEMTVTIAGGDKSSFEVPVVAAGEGR